MTDFNLEYRQPEHAKEIFTQVISRMEFLFSGSLKSSIGTQIKVKDFEFSLLLDEKYLKYISQVSKILIEDFEIEEYEQFFNWYLACNGNNTSLIKLLTFMRKNNFPEDSIVTWKQILAEDPIMDLFFNDDTKSCENGIVVCEEIGDIKSNEGRSLKSRYEGIVGTPLPFSGNFLNLDSSYDYFMEKYPWAKETINLVFGQICLSGVDEKFRLPNILVYGSPGCGKTKLLSELADKLEMNFGLFPCGGSNDSSGLLPVARGWSTSKACGPIQLMLQGNNCNPVIVLDEIEKAQQVASKNTTLSSSLLSMMSNNGVYYDTCLQSNVNLAYVSYMATANSLEGLPEPLLDRFFVVNMNSPSNMHFDLIMSNVMDSEAGRLGVSMGQLPKLEDWEVDALRVFLEGKTPSIRSLEKSYRLLIGAKIMKNRIKKPNIDNILDGFF